MSNTVNNYTETDLGNISLNPRGEYDSSVEYEYLDAVSYQGGSYFAWQSWRQRSPELLLMRDAIRNIGR